jgi:hypothetical protein
MPCRTARQSRSDNRRATLLAPTLPRGRRARALRGPVSQGEQSNDPACVHPHSPSRRGHPTTGRRSTAHPSSRSGFRRGFRKLRNASEAFAMVAEAPQARRKASRWRRRPSRWPPKLRQRARSLKASAGGLLRALPLGEAKPDQRIPHFEMEIMKEGRELRMCPRPIDARSRRHSRTLRPNERGAWRSSR